MGKSLSVPNLLDAEAGMNVAEACSLSSIELLSDTRSLTLTVRPTGVAVLFMPER